MIERKTLAQEMEDILNRLKELEKLDFPTALIGTQTVLG